MSRTMVAGDVGALTPAEALVLATEAYIYGYPLVTMEITRRVMTNTAKQHGTHGPMGQLRSLRTYPDASFREVTAPNADTLYSAGWIDVSREPYVLSIPDIQGRYYLMPMLDAWTNVFQAPGKRTTGTGPQTYAITGPGWKGTLPAGVTQYKSPTSLVWILGRTYCTGTPQDYQEVHAFQDQLSLVPLSAYGKPYTAPDGVVDPKIDMHTPVREQVNRLDGVEFFKLMAELMKNNPPASADAPIVSRMAMIGIVPGQSFDVTKLEPVLAAAIRDVPKPALQNIAAYRKDAGTGKDGWVISKPTGLYGTGYLHHATVTFFGLGANLTQDAVYPVSESTAEGTPYSGAHKYVLHFAKDELPPVKAFWSLTMYDSGYFFVANPLNRRTLSQRDQLKFNSDGSVDLYLQADNPGAERESNWLPAPKEKFLLMLRLYWPKENPPSILDGTWNPPAVRKVA
jgi:hypothetical protein